LRLSGVGILGYVNPSPEIEAVIKRFRAARRVGDLGQIRNLLSDSPDLRIIGTDENEWAKGDTAIAIMSAHWEAQKYEADETLRLEAFESGDAGWAAIEGRQVSEARDIDHRYRITFALVLEAGTWKIVQIHYSVPVSNIEINHDVELSRTLAELLQSLQGDSRGERAWAVPNTSTIVFTDVVGSTALSHTMGSQAWSELIGSHLDTLRSIVEENGGSVVKTLGDGGMYAFQSASSALTAAGDIQRAMVGSDLEVRLGVHTGDVVRERDDYIGLTVAKAARVASAADGGQILVSASTIGMVNPAEFHFNPPLMVELKGLEGTHQLHPLNWS
jgi:class 3 adenylate cyclase/ketosteroid isomerase-like protein